RGGGGGVGALDVHGRPSFTSLAERMHVRDRGRAARLAASLPVTYMIFDLLRYDGTSLLSLPYADRRERLEDLDLDGPHWMVPPVFPDGAATAAAARENRLGGVVAKRRGAPHPPRPPSPGAHK